ncbi:MAG: two-component regulator propeller domain-containing protein, partial [Blastocatellia bacterium]
MRISVNEHPGWSEGYNIRLIGWLMALAMISVPGLSQSVTGKSGRSSDQLAPKAKSFQRYIVTAWDANKGLPLNSVTSIVETRDGYLWVGMLGGLARFDGIKFTVFNAGRTPGMSGNRINGLLQDHSGTLWIWTEEGGLTGLDHGVFRSYTQKDGL